MRSSERLAAADYGNIPQAACVFYDLKQAAAQMRNRDRTACTIIHAQLETLPWCCAFPTQGLSFVKLPKVSGFSWHSVAVLMGGSSN